MAKRIIAVVIIILFLYVGNAFLFPFPVKRSSISDKSTFGTSFSFEQVRWYGLDANVAFEELAKSGKFTWIRVPFFWDQMTDEAGNLKIDDLVFAAKTAEKYHIKLIIALGAKTPYYPEYHIPEMYSGLIKFGDTIGLNSPIAKSLLETDIKLVRELSQYKSIGWWQVENEPFLANVNNWKIDKGLLAWEVAAVRKVDLLNRPIILNGPGSSIFSRDFSDLISLLKPGDIYGVGAYFKTQGTNLFSLGSSVSVPWPKFLIWPVQSWYLISPDFNSMRHRVETGGINFWIMEAQAEPYIRILDDARQSHFSFESGDIKKAVEFLKGSNVKNIGLWGAPFWLYREKVGDKSWLAAVYGLN